MSDKKRDKNAQNTIIRKSKPAMQGICLMFRTRAFRIGKV